jgi:D-sedoheptulose 7-phosphate isomerase
MGDAAMGHTEIFLQQVVQVAEQLDREAIDGMVRLLVQTREQRGRLFILGVGGSAANASHAVNDFRKIAGMEAYAPTDNVSELTARVNDDGWETVFAAWLQGSRLNEKDLVFAMSVGGGNRELNVSVNLVRALEYAKEMGAKVCGIVGRDGGFTGQVADVCVEVPTVDEGAITPLAEAFQGVVWHLIVSHPELKVGEMKWESIKG